MERDELLDQKSTDRTGWGVRFFGGKGYQRGCSLQGGKGVVIKTYRKHIHLVMSTLFDHFGGHRMFFTPSTFTGGYSPLSGDF